MAVQIFEQTNTSNMRRPSLRFCRQFRRSIFHSLFSLLDREHLSIPSSASSGLRRLGGSWDENVVNCITNSMAPSPSRYAVKLLWKILRAVVKEDALLHWLKLISRNSSCEKRLNLRSTVHRIQWFCESLWWAFPSICWYLDENNPEMWHVADTTEMERSKLI